MAWLWIFSKRMHSIFCDMNRISIINNNYYIFFGALLMPLAEWCANSPKSRIHIKNRFTHTQLYVRLLSFRFNPNCFGELFLFDCHIEKKNTQIHLVNAFECGTNIIATYFSYKLHYYLLMFSNRWSPISWYLNRYLRLLHMLAWAYRIAFFFHRHWKAFIAVCARLYGEYQHINHKIRNQIPRRTKIDYRSKQVMWCGIFFFCFQK